MADSLTPAALQAALTTRRFGRNALMFEQVGSTNDVAHAQAAAGASDGTLVLADEQLAGRGRQGRSWWAPRGSSLLMSLLLRPAIPAALAGQLTMCLGLGAVEGVEQATGLRPALKWPNDLLLDERKLAGMLAELQAEDDRVGYAVLGLGLNVNGDFAAFPEQAPDAISLQMALGQPVARLPLLAAILARCEYWYDEVLAGRSPHTAWSARLRTIGRRVRASLLEGVLEGVATGVSPEGALLLQTGDGQTRTIWAGDVSSVRPA